MLPEGMIGGGTREEEMKTTTAWFLARSTVSAASTEHTTDRQVDSKNWPKFSSDCFSVVSALGSEVLLA